MRAAAGRRWELSLPEWVEELAPFSSGPYPTVEERMGVVLALARRAVSETVGGPFAAAVFEAESHRLVAAGVNLVFAAGSSVAHAEVVALVMAQQELGSHHLGAPGLPACELVTSTEPCAMCLGAVPWSGVRRLVCGAREEDARAVGFDEGDKPERWPEALAARGIEVLRDVSREAAREVLRRYHAAGGRRY
jgi:tRNA(Arg) A34 adenosine deaminase TadA